MSKRMLIDAQHSEETRVTVISGNRVEEFDYESSNRRELKGNIYLAKVTRVEPSLQAAFVDYGGNRHGFLAFSEIHPDYYQIPVEDREAILAEEAAIHADAVEEEPVEADAAEEAVLEGKNADGEDDGEDSTNDDADEDAAADAAPEDAGEGGDDDIEQDALRLRRLRSLKRRYKIQEVIKPRQIMLIQVVKEERGNKGAALTTYLSLAGRYTVLMPNTTHGGGISRKIASAADRKRLKSIIEDLNIPAGTGCIVRTAGMKRTKTEIKRDVDYLFKIWTNIRELTLKSVAPALVYEEGNLIKRAIRDLYDRNIDEVLVDGEKGYKTAKDFMKLLMPSHAKRVVAYKDETPLFQRFQIENQLETIYNPVVTLKSGGYIVINPTEALIAIDVNSGRATKHRNIEDTALKTNVEAAYEIARQLRLRDMAGLVVIDFIDMEDRGNNRQVERKIKDALKSDRARIQVGRISSLGLMEISRQRLHPNLVEATTEVCPHCDGVGRVRTVDSAALHLIRAIEEEALKGRFAKMHVRVHPDVAFYALNNKRQQIIKLEARYGISIEIMPDASLVPPATEISGSGGRAPKRKPDGKMPPPKVTADQIEDEEELEEDNSESNQSDEDSESDESRRRRRGGRRRGRRGGRRARAAREARAKAESGEDGSDANAADAEAGDKPKSDDKGDADDKPKRGRRRPRSKKADDVDEQAKADVKADAKADVKDDVEEPTEAKAEEEKPKRRSRSTSTKKPAARKGSAQKADDQKADDQKADDQKADDQKADDQKAGDEKAGKEEEAAKKATKAPARKRTDAKKPAAKKPAAKKPAAKKPAAKKPAAKKPAAKKSVAKKKADDKTDVKASEEKPAEGKADDKAAGSDKTEAPKKRGWWQRA